MSELEDRLRDALRSRARAVEPDPRAWRRVESRIQRRRVLTWAVPATAAAAVAAVAVLVLPGILPGQDNGIELGVADDPTEDPEPEDDDGDVETLVDRGVVPVPALEGRVAGIAWADGQVRAVQTPAGEEVGHGPLGPVAGLTVAPGSDIDQFALASGAVDPDGACRGQAKYHVRAERSHFSSDSVGDCASAPRFSPDGQYVARVVRDGSQAIDIRTFEVGGPDSGVQASSRVQGAEGDLEIVAWLAGPEGEDVLYLLDRGADASGLYPVTVGRPSRGGGEPGFSLPSEIDVGEQPSLDTGSWRVEAAAPRSASAPRAHGLALVQAQDDEARLWLRGYEEDEPVVVALPTELARADGRAWVFADGDDVLAGDGVSGVWHIALDDDEPAAQRLDVEWMTAALLPLEAGDDPGDLVDAEDAEDSEDSEDEERHEATITAYFVRDGGARLWVEPASVPLHAPTVGVARAAMEALTTTPNGELDTLLPAGTRVLGVAINEGVLRLDLSAHVSEEPLGSEAEAMLAEQLAHTAAQFEGVEAVRLLVGGVAVSELWGHLDWSEPIAPDEFALSPVVIDEAGASDGRIEVSGEATVYEATVELTLLGPDGETVEETYATATCGGPCRGEWSHTFAPSGLRSGTWRVVAAQPHVTDEGPPPFETTVEVRVD